MIGGLIKKCVEIDPSNQGQVIYQITFEYARISQIFCH